MAGNRKFICLSHFSFCKSVLLKSFFSLLITTICKAYNSSSMSLIVSATNDQRYRKYTRVLSALFGVVIKDWYLLLFVFLFFVYHTVIQEDEWLGSFLIKFLFPTISYVIFVVSVGELGVFQTMLFFTVFFLILMEYSVLAPLYINNQ